MEEWNSIPKDMVQNLCRGYLERVKKVVEIEGGRIEPEYFKKKEAQYKWEKPLILPNERIIYNDKILSSYKKREIKYLKKEKKDLKSKYSGQINKIRKKIKTKKFKKTDLKNMSLGRAMSIIKDEENAINDKNKAESEKDQSLESLNEKINLISKMNAFEYLHHINGEEDNSESTNEVERKINNLEELMKENKQIKYKKIKFNSN